jgi:uracil phosphoribosyltransferase
MRKHHYGPQVTILDDPYLLSLLARLGAPETGTESVPGLVRSAYFRLLQEVFANHFPLVETRVKTRMAATEASTTVRSSAETRGWSSAR